MEGASKDTIKQIFNMFDKNHNGELDKDEIKSVVNELGMQMTLDQIDTLFYTVDSDKNGTISFDEFFAWWQFCSKDGGYSDMNEFVKLVLKAQSKLTKVKNIVGAIPQGDQTTNTHTILVKSSLDNMDAPATRLAVDLFISGDEIKKVYQQHSGTGLDITQDGPNVIIALKAKEPHAAKQALEAMVENAMQMAEMLIEDYAQYKAFFKYTYAIDGDYVKLAVHSSHPMVGLVMGPVAVASMLIPESNQSSDICFEACIADDVITALNSETNIIVHILRSFLLRLKVSVRKDLLEVARQALYQRIRDNIAKGKNDKKAAYALLLLGIKGVDLELNLKSSDEAYVMIQKFIQQEMMDDGEITLKKFLTELKEPFQSAKGEIPMFEDIINMFMTHFESNIQVSVLTQAACAQLSFRTRGIKECIDHLNA